MRPVQSARVVEVTPRVPARRDQAHKLHRTWVSSAKVDNRWWVIALVLVTVACNPARGCIESNVALADESRLPTWFDGAGVPRVDATVTMDYYVGPVGTTVTFPLRDARGWKVAEAVGIPRGKKSIALEPDADYFTYPRFRVVDVGREFEVIEHRRMEPTFYINDDTEVRRKLGLR